MPIRIPDETLQAIRERANIVDIVSNYVSLKRAGRNHLGLCPFHAEKSPSFTVSDERGLFHCFGCGAGGSVFNFLMRIENIEFLDAVRQLAQRVGIEVALSKDDGSRNERERLVALNEHVQRRLRNAIASNDGAAAREYLARRGLSSEAIERFGIGFCPRSGTGLASALSAKPDALKAGIALGLVSKRDDGRVYERLWGRITFPIRDVSGAILGFGGRAIFDQQPKYLNSPESSLFHKGNVLYGLYEAKQSIRERQRIVLVEGYLDAIALAEHGIAEVVASLGTALTPAQLRLAKRYAATIIAFFDGDNAGQKAAMRAFETSLEAGVQALGAFLPQGADPDDFVRSQGAQATQKLLERAVPLSDFFVAQLSPSKTAPLHERIAAAERIAVALKKIEDPLEFGMIAQKAAQRLAVDETIFRDVHRRPSANRAIERRELPNRPREQAVRSEESMLLDAAAVSREVAAAIAARRVTERFENREVAQCVDHVLHAWAAGESPDAALDRVSERESARISAALIAAQQISPAAALQMVEDCCYRVEERRADELMALLQQAQEEGDQQRVIEYAEAFSDLKRALKTSNPAAVEKEHP